AIGSITKTFTATMLALYSHRGWVYVPAAVPPPPGTATHIPTRLRDLTSYPIMWQWYDVTLEQLAMHHGMLPRDPPSPTTNYQLGSETQDFDALFDTLAVCPSGQ